MLRASIPAKFPILFAAGAGPGFIDVIPQTPSATPGKASFQTGFPEVTFEQIAAGGTPPWGADFNGLFNALTAWHQWAQAGGFPVKYDAAFATAIGGYPQYAFLLSSSPGSFGKMWMSTVDNNLTDPDGGGASGWVLFPDVLIQRQKNNYAVDTGATNQVTIDLGIYPANWAAIVGMPIRIKAAHANTVNNPTLTVMGAGNVPLAPATIVNPGGAVLGIGQFAASDIIEGVPKDDGTFQINAPAKQYSPSGTFPIPGFIMPWPNETAPSGFRECNGDVLAIASFPNLWPVLGARYGGDGVNTFALPNYRGEFLRGWDHGRGLDPNAATRGNSGGGITGDHVGTVQNYAAHAPSAALVGPISIAQPLATANGPPATAGITSPNWPSPLASGFPLDIVDIGGANVGFGTSWVGAPNPGWTTAWPYGGNPALGIAPWQASITGTATFNASGGDAETRPVNINVMWVIFTG